MFKTVLIQIQSTVNDAVRIKTPFLEKRYLYC